MAIADDRELMTRAAERAEDLFPLLRRRAYGSLLVLLAFLPGIYAVVWASLTEGGALWGLRSLDVYTATETVEIFDPGGGDESRSLRWQPPLENWLTALVMTLFGPANTLSLWLVPYAATAGLVAMFFLLCDRLGGPRFGLWGAIMLSCHGPLLAQAQDPAPESLAQVLVLVGFWGVLTHQHRPGRLLSLPLAVAGVALGLAFLAGGPLALAAVLSLAVWVLTLRGDTPRPRRASDNAPRRDWNGRLALRSLLLAIGIAALVCGWWIGWMTVRHGASVWLAWLTGHAPEFVDLQDGDNRSLLRFLSQGGVQMLGPLAGLALLGGWMAARDLRFSTDARAHDRAAFLLAWTGCAFIGWVIQVTLSQAGTSAEPSWRGFLLLPGIALAAWAVEEISRRHVSTRLVIGVAGATALALLWPPLLRAAREFSRSQSLALGTFAAIIICGAWFWLLKMSVGTDSHQRLILKTLLLGLLLGNAVAGLKSVQRAGEDDVVLTLFRTDLAGIHDVNSWTLITSQPPPRSLWWTLRASWPDAQSRPVVENWDAALSQALADGQIAQQKHIVVDWSERDIRPTALQIRDVQITPLTRPRFLHRRHLRAFGLASSE